MSLFLNEFKYRITSENVDVLKQSLEFVRRCLLQENERGKAAETRATVMLGILGVIATLIIPRSDDLATKSELSDERWFLLVWFVSCLLFLVKGLYYAILTISNSKRYRLEPKYVFDFQKGSHVDALRSEIAGILWEYDHSIKFNSRRLFHLQRCQRNSFVTILILVLFGLVSLETLRHWIDVPTCISISFGVVSGIIWLFLDPVAERIGGVWKK